MKKTVKNTIDDLKNTLAYLFEKVYFNSGVPDDKNYSIRCKPNTSTYKRQERSNFVVSYSDNGELQYILRYRIRADSDNKRNKIYLYRENSWMNIRQIVEERDTILDVLMKNRGIENITNDEYEEITELFNEIEDLLFEYRNYLSIEEVRNMIENYKKDELQNYVARNSYEASNFWKLLYSGSEKNDLTIEYKSESTILVRSKRQYQEKEYNFGLVIQDDNDIGFRINRVRKQIFSEHKEWSESKINNILGYSIDINNINQSISVNQQVRVIGNLYVEKYDYNKIKQDYKSRIRQLIIDDNFNLYHQYYKEYNDINGMIELNITNSGYFSKDTSTKRLKEIQSNLNISEENVRKVQRYRNIGRLSSNLRAEIILDLYKDKLLNWIINKNKSRILAYQNKFRKNEYNKFDNYRSRIGNSNNNIFKDILVNNPQDITYKNIRDISNNIAEERFNQQTNITIELDNYNIEITGCSTLPRDMKEHNLGSTQKIVVPDSSMFYCYYQSKEQTKFKLNKGVYRFSKLGNVNHYKYI